MPSILTKEQEQAMQCAGKNAFDTFAMAAKVAKNTAKGRANANIGPYRCKHCQRYHVGSLLRGK